MGFPGGSVKYLAPLGDQGAVPPGPVLVFQRHQVPVIVVADNRFDVVNGVEPFPEPARRGQLSVHRVAGVELVALPVPTDVGGSNRIQRRPDLVEIGGAHAVLVAQFGEACACLLDVHDSPLIASFRTNWFGK